MGVPDERYGEVVAAFVIPREQSQKKKDTPAADEDGIKGWVREKLSNHLGMFFFFFLDPLIYCLGRDGVTYPLVVPRYVFFLSPSDSLPKTASGKIQKFKLKESAIRILNETQST